MTTNNEVETMPEPDNSALLDQRIATIMLRQLTSMRGFPPTPSSLTCIATAFMAIVGTVDGAQKLIDEVAEGCEYFPMPIQMRRMWCKHDPPFDGREEWKVDKSHLM